MYLKWIVDSYVCETRWKCGIAFYHNTNNACVWEVRSRRWTTMPSHPDSTACQSKTGRLPTPHPPLVSVAMPSPRAAVGTVAVALLVHCVMAGEHHHGHESFTTQLSVLRATQTALVRDVDAVQAELAMVVRPSSDCIAHPWHCMRSVHCVRMGAPVGGAHPRAAILGDCVGL